MIEVDEIDVSYGNIQVLWDLSFTVSEDDRVVSIVGPNGAGKSTLLRVMSGLHPVDDGRVTAWGDDVAGLEPSDIVKRGFVHVSEERNLFGDMSVRENLEMGAYTQRGSLDETMQEVFELFPILEERQDQRAASMSGGQQQMLAIGRGLMARPKILALDEPSEGLAPKITNRVFEKIEEISDNVTVLLVEQHVHKALGLADRAYLLENGEIITEDTGPSLLESDHIKEAYL
ncbi:MULTISPECIES: ABC transporter ATP-binding protein [Haloferax]|uniref:ABC-type branched-chain amino acid transport system, ATPase component n=3 Tax=Haloferax TaxID=2251 RepID=M0HY90_9EURY|nr:MULTISPECIES: ABC transporter ATP-binding protein [Haloferax]ELZ88672.1 ABC-type branched-chain amino acid transport system, ATPase component [Haloferax sulfurifontis ATCC BAA-897]EMA07481.1 ABC-type branched-chain amino acid transport system, ATPase component [Haloferax denitrificans ATCC 35960]GGC66367.1 ABC transporter ATP-binding protein [Haloferax sulfurifontis]